MDTDLILWKQRPFFVSEGKNICVKNVLMPTLAGMGKYQPRWVQYSRMQPKLKHLAIIGLIHTYLFPHSFQAQICGCTVPPYSVQNGNGQALENHK